MEITLRTYSLLSASLIFLLISVLSPGITNAAGTKKPRCACTVSADNKKTAVKLARKELNCKAPKTISCQHDFGGKWKCRCKKR